MPWLERHESSEACCVFVDLQSLVSAFRGLLALVSSIPNHLGAQNSDVDFVFPTKMRHPPIFEAIPRFGKVLAQSLKAVRVWGERVDMYKKFLGAEAKQGPTWTSLDTALSEALASRVLRGVLNTSAVKPDLF